MTTTVLITELSIITELQFNNSVLLVEKNDWSTKIVYVNFIWFR